MRPRGTSATNYKLPEVLLLLDLIKSHLPLGKDEWERVAARYNETKTAVWMERDYESLRRKFKTLAATKKPTGTAFIPAHILSAKEIKEEIDSKAGVVDLDDNGDEDDLGLDEEYEYAVDAAGGEESKADDAGHEAHAGYWHPVMATASLSPSTPINTELATFSSTTAFTNGLDVFNPVRYSAVPRTPAVVATVTAATGVDDEETRRYPGMRDFSNRLGGGVLSSEGAGRGKSNADTEASFTKKKKVKAESAIAGLRSKFDESNALVLSGRNDTMQMLFMMREDGERKAEERRELEEQRRRQDKEEREERRRVDKAEAEERRRLEKDESHTRSKELMMLIAALVKK